MAGCLSITGAALLSCSRTASRLGELPVGEAECWLRQLACLPRPRCCGWRPLHSALCTLKLNTMMHDEDGSKASCMCQHELQAWLDDTQEGVPATLPAAAAAVTSYCASMGPHASRVADVQAASPCPSGQPTSRACPQTPASLDGFAPRCPGCCWWTGRWWQGLLQGWGL